MCKYRRVTYGVRCQIDGFLQAGWSVPEISAHLGYHKSTIYRELKRNNGFKTYSAFEADRLAMRRYKACRVPHKIKGNIAQFIAEAIIIGWSPVQISGRLLKEKNIKISHECIYQFTCRYPELRKALRRKGMKPKGGRHVQRRSMKLKGRSIKDRPVIANERRRIGDWERDNMYGANRKQLLVCLDRKTRYTKITKLKNTESKTVGEQTMKLIKETGKKAFTITNDNGSEFRGKPIPIKTFYCEPMKPQQRGSVENTIGLLRQWISRKTDLDKLTDEELRDIENKLNLRPRKCLNFRTPFEVFFNVNVALAF